MCPSSSLTIEIHAHLVNFKASFGLWPWGNERKLVNFTLNLELREAYLSSAIKCESYKNVKCGERASSRLPKLVSSNSSFRWFCCSFKWHKQPVSRRPKHSDSHHVPRLLGCPQLNGNKIVHFSHSMTAVGINGRNKKNKAPYANPKLIPLNCSFRRKGKVHLHKIYATYYWATLLESSDGIA